MVGYSPIAMKANPVMDKHVADIVSGNRGIDRPKLTANESITKRAEVIFMLVAMLFPAIYYYATNRNIGIVALVIGFFSWWFSWGFAVVGIGLGVVLALYCLVWIGLGARWLLDVIERFVE